MLSAHDNSDNVVCLLSKSDSSSFCQKAHLELGLDTELENTDPIADF